MVGSKFSTNVHLALWPTALGVPAAVGHGVRGHANGRSPSLWGQAPDVVANGGRIPDAVWRRGPRRQEPAYTRGRAPAADLHSSLPSSIPSAFNRFGALLRYVAKFSPV
jgi:hypothetical protein